MEKIAILSAVRSPFCKSGGVFKHLLADDLGALTLKELLLRTPIPFDLVDEVVIGNVMQPSHATNIARVIALKAGLPDHVPAYTVNRNCSSGLEAITSAARKIALGEADLLIAGGVESMTHFPILFPSSMREFLTQMNKSKGFLDQLKQALRFRPSMLMPQVPQLADPLCGLSMGQTAEKIAREFKVSREEQDLFALESHKRAARALQEKRFEREIAPVPLAKSYQLIDDGIRENPSLESLRKLKPAFDKLTGTVTAGNSSQLTDGASFLYLSSEKKAKELGLQPIGYLTAQAAAGLDPSRMGLGPVFATAKLFKQTGLTLKDIDLIEINEAFAAQVLAVTRAFNCPVFANQQLNQDHPLGEINMEKLNVNGGAIALGHPLGASGARLVQTLLTELNLRKLKRGLATLCVGGGQGQACIVEAAL